MQATSSFIRIALIDAFIMVICIPAPCAFAEYKLIKLHSKWAMYLPIIVFAFSIIFGLYTVIISAVMFIIYYINNKNNKNINDEIDKMNKQDLG